MPEPAQKCENNDIFKQTNALVLLIYLKMAIFCCFGLRGNLDFPDFLQLKFYNINSRDLFLNKTVCPLGKGFLTY